MASRGRRPRLTPAVRTQICLALREGHYQDQAAASAGVSHSSLASWLADARAIRAGLPRPSGQTRPSASELLELLEAVEAATYHATELGLSAVRQAVAKGDWKAGAWYLTHRFPRQWGGVASHFDSETEELEQQEERKALAESVRAKIFAMANSDKQNGGSAGP